MRNLLTFLTVCLLACAAYAELTNDNTTIALWRMDTIVSGDQPYVPDDDYGTNYFSPRNGNLLLGTDSQPERVPTLVSDSRPGGSGHCLQYDGDSVKHWSVGLSVWNGLDFHYDSVKVEFWFKPLSLPEGTSTYTVMGASVWELRINGNGRVQFLTRDNDDTARWCLTDNDVVEVNKWHHLTLEFLDGVQTVTVISEDDLQSPQTWTTTGLSPMKLVNFGLYVGGGSNIGTPHAHMRLDETKISVPNMPGIDDGWQNPRQDNIDTYALIHFDEIMDPNYSPDPQSIYTPDNNSFNPRRRAFHSKFLDFSSAQDALVDSINPEFGKCVEFDGYDNRMLITYRDKYDYVVREDFRVEAWAKLGDDVANVETGLQMPVVSQQWSYRFYYQFEDGQWKISGVFGYDRDGTLVGRTIRAPIANPREWNHIAIQWNKGQMSLYINGELVDRYFDRNAANSVRVSSDRLCIGSQGSTTSSAKFSGYIDEVRLVNIYPQNVPCSDETAGYPAGDVNRDCSANILDFAILADQWLQELDTSSAYDWTDLEADLNYSFNINIADLKLLTADWLVE